MNTSPQDNGAQNTSAAYSSAATGTDVTARDNESGESETTTILDNYVIVTDGSAEVERVDVSEDGTSHFITVKGIRRG